MVGPGRQEVGDEGQDGLGDEEAQAEEQAEQEIVEGLEHGSVL